MSEAVKETVNLMEILPEKNKRLVIAWDPDYTKVTKAERLTLEAAE